MEYDNFLFFDDDINNIEMCTSLGVVGELVNGSVGLTKEVFLRGLTSFAFRNISNKLSITTRSSPIAVIPTPMLSQANSPMKPIGVLPRRMNGFSMNHLEVCTSANISPCPTHYASTPIPIPSINYPTPQIPPTEEYSDHSLSTTCTLSLVNSLDSSLDGYSTENSDHV